MKTFLKKFIIISNAILIILPLNLLYFQAERAHAAEDVSDTLSTTDLSHEQDGPITAGWVINSPDPPMPESVKQLQAFTSDNAINGSDEINNVPIDKSFLWLATNTGSSAKLLFNPTDLQDLRILYCLGSVIPDFANHDDALAASSGKTIADIVNLRTNDLTNYQKLIQQAQEKSRVNIVSNLKNDLPNFACIAGVDVNQAADMLKYDQPSVNAIIDNAQNKVVIDRRVLELLVNLVTPKDQGGAGHELINVLRVRNNYNRDAKSNSAESRAIYQQMAQATNTNKSTLNTVGDVASADSNALNADPTIAASTGQAEILDSAGASQGNLIFSDAETASNISAHYKGEAVDISSVDNIKCTLIKKVRIDIGLSANKPTKLPATPINLAWQTSSGYDNSPPPDYSSLNANLRQLASGNYAELLNQLGVSVDSTTDLSHATFSDIVGLIGQSLLGELLNSPNMSLSGSTFADTIKKIGGMVLADDLGLPRQAFINANLADVNDLETKIGEAVLEKKLNLPWGSLQGNNLNDIFVNIGERHVESSLNIPNNTLTSSITDQNNLKLTIGRRTIESSLSLPSNSFASDTTFTKLKQVAGARKIDLIFQNPASVDERLGLGLNNAVGNVSYSSQYKTGGLSPDAYATVVANKVLSDNVYSYASSSASASAARLSVNSSTNSDPTPSSDSRMTNILNGTNLQSNFQQIGIEILAQSLSNDSNVRAALIQWFNGNLANSNCAVQSAVTVPIIVAGATVNVTLPEDQFMANFGFRRGDFYRLFGCINVNSAPVLQNLGTSALYNAIANSTAARQAESSFLAQNPGITSVLQTVNFYTARVKTIQTTVAKIQNDWSGVNNNDQNLGIFRTNISTAAAALSGINTSNPSSGIQAINVIRSLAISFDQASGALQGSSSANQNLHDKINATLLDFSIISQSVAEILGGQPQSNISSLQLNQLGSIGLNNTQGTNSATQLSVASLALMLSGKLSPTNFLISVGSNKIESSLDLPLNSIYYYANYVLNKPSDAAVNGKDAFFQSIGQAQLEETLHMPPNFFQGGTPGSAATLSDVRDHVASVWGISGAEAGARIMQALNLPGDFSSIQSASSNSAGSSIGLAANNLDTRLSLPTGTTLKFLNGGAVATNTLGNSDAELIAGRLNLPQNILNTFTRVKTGSQSLADGLRQSFTSLITFNSHNSYIVPQIPVQNNPTACPINFSYTTQNGLSFSISNQIQDNSYVYADANGTHAFPSVNQAQHYAETNQSSQVDFIKGLAQGFSSDLSNPSNFNSAEAAHYRDELDNFLANQNQAQALPDNEVNDISNRLNIPTAALGDLLNRKDLLDNLSQKPINPFLAFIGKRTAESRITTALFGSLGITVAGMKIDATDIFDLFSGNALSVVERIGASYIGQQLGIGPNQIANVIQSASSIIRNCSLATLGANFVGGVLGLGSVSLSGNIYNNIGEAKIEKVLNLPANSFVGASLQELMDNVGPVAFARAFQLPPSAIFSSDIISSLALGPTISDQSIAGQYQAVESRVSFPDLANTTISLGSTNTRLEQNISTAIGSGFTGSIPDTFSATTSAQSISSYQTANFLNQAKSIDSQLGIASGTTQKLLLGQITPDAYRKLAADSVMTNLATNLAGTGVLGSGILGQIVGFAGIATQITRCASTSSTSRCDYGSIFTELSQVFGINLDSKIGLPPGTIGRIIQNPEQAAATLLLSALSRLDNSLGLVDGNGNPLPNASLTAAYIGLGGPLPIDPSQGQPVNYSNNWTTGTMQFRANDTVSTGSGHGLIFDTVTGSRFSTGDRWAYYGRQIGEQLVGDYLNKIGIIPVTTSATSTPYTLLPNSGPYAGAPTTQQLILQNMDMLVRGDLRGLELDAAVRAAMALHIYNDSTTPNLPNYFRITYEDIYYSIMGNPTMEASYVNAATNNYLTVFAQRNLSALQPPTNTDTMTAVTNAIQYGSQCPPGGIGTAGFDCYNPSHPTGAGFNTYNSYASTAADHAAGLSSDPTLANNTLIQVLDNPLAADGLHRVQETARNQADTATRYNLLWRMADAKIYQLDPNIPAGFARTMYSGTGAERTAMLLTFLGNSLLSRAFGGISFGIAELGTTVYDTLTNYFKDPAHFSWSSISNTAMTSIDGFLAGKLNGILGFQWQPGTFAALAHGFSTGDYTHNFSINGGPQITSLTNLYENWVVGKITGWADHALGLPPGTVFQAYQIYKNFEAAQTALIWAQNAQALSWGASGIGADADVAAAQANLAAVETAAIAFVVNLVFAKQIGQFEAAVGLVPGTGAMLVTMLITGFNPISVAIFVLMNLFLSYKTEVSCTADGYYPKIDDPAKVADPSVVDNGNLGTFDGMDANAKKAGYIAAAQYKAQTLAGDALKLSERSGDPLAIPSQIMVGRQEDVDYWQYKTNQVICDKVGGCAGSRAGMWYNPQTTAYTHIGF